MRKTTEFQAFGVKYKTTQFSAADGISSMGSFHEAYPTDILRLTYVWGDGEWHSLSEVANINKYVRDGIEDAVLIPKQVLTALISLVSEYTYGFLNEWKAVKIPGRFLTESTTVNSAASEPMLSALIQEGTATLKELEEYYSLEDAFKMFDILVSKGINEAYANEAAEKAAKNKH